MGSTICSIVAAFVLLGTTAAGAIAQIPMVFGSWNAGVLAGASVPTGTTGDQFESGWTAAAWGSYSPIASRLSIRAQVSYHHFQPASGTQGSSATLWGYTGDAIMYLGAVYLRPYLLAGGGVHTRTGHGTDISWHAGGGFAFPFLGRTILFESRYLNVGTGADRFRTVPVTVGLVF